MWFMGSLHEVVVGGRRTVVVMIVILVPIYVSIVDKVYE